ncbi:MAG: glutamine-hydrolyzing GMP synthase [Candidatus Zixiibacteriota bacterium]
MRPEMVLILDFGSQYTQLIARRVRELHVYCEIAPYNRAPGRGSPEYAGAEIKGYILSGGPNSVTETGAPRLDPEFFETDIPILGICYGMQLIADLLGGRLERSHGHEYGNSTLSVAGNGGLFAGADTSSRAWMSHGDSIVELPEGFSVTASTESLPIAAIANDSRRIYGIQFHPEVSHTSNGRTILENFVKRICGCAGNWTEESFIEAAVANVRERVGGSNVALGISGGVDSSVAALLLQKAIGPQLHPIFVDNGLLRKNEFEEVMRMFADFGLDVDGIDASEMFLKRLEGVTDPERKRKIIGGAFIDVFEERAGKIGNVEFLAQGTLYPDVIESVSFKGPSATIKSHHNVGGLKERMRLRLVEPLRELFKDEVRAIGRKLGLAEEFLGRHPFPGPGLAVRILGAVTPERLQILREADEIYLGELRRSGHYDEVWQAFATLLPVQTVGVMGDERTYENVIALRAVTSLDGMTADWARIPDDILARISNAIINKVRGVNRVVYDISSKPPATIEWE